MEFRKKKIFIEGDENGKICESLIFNKWLESLDKELSIDYIKLINFKENSEKKIVYIKLSVVVDMNGNKISRFVFLEGPSIALIAFLKNENGEYKVFLENKPFIASSKVIKSIPYMKFNDFNISKKTAKSIFDKKLEISVKENECFDLLLSLNDKNTENFVYPLPGSSDDRCFYFAVNISNKTLNDSVSSCFFPLKESINTSKDYVTKTGLVLLNKYLKLL